MSETGFDWRGLMTVAFRELRLKPWEFWALTPHELQVMLGRDTQVGPMSFSDFDGLLSRFPDQGIGDPGPDNKENFDG